MNSSGKNRLITATITVGLGMIFASDAASAVTRPRAHNGNATGSCQSALPVFDGQIRKRPLAIQNEGTASAFVSCAFTVPNIDTGVSNVYLYADNNNSSAVDMTCTLVTGLSGYQPRYINKTITMAPNSLANTFAWGASDNAGLFFQDYALSVSCNLPVGTGLTLTQILYNEDVGA